jgi:hypothetical protein
MQTRAERGGEKSGFFPVEAQPGPEDAMKWDGSWMRARSRDQLAILKVRERDLDGASGEPCGGGNWLMGQADWPVGLLRCITIKVKIDDERSRTAIMAHQVGQEAVKQVRVKGDLYHRPV